MNDRDDYLSRLARLGIDPAEIEERFSRSSGPGGQHVNKVSTAVTLTHAPSGTSVTVSDTRSQARNRELARERLVGAIEEARQRLRAGQRAEREKKRRRNRPRPAGVQRRILADKKRHGEKKKLRGKVPGV
ncbi:MAG TPA: peptide chain release factor-like protein [Chthoniobacteraceae bacterium]|nr:peptide chain release factor-like protein [Chthoniobacteraceae bacterium]